MKESGGGISEGVLLGLDEIMQVVLGDRHLTNYHTHAFRLIDSPISKFAIWECFHGWLGEAVMTELVADDRVARTLENSGRFSTASLLTGKLVWWQRRDVLARIS